MIASSRSSGCPCRTGGGVGGVRGSGSGCDGGLVDSSGRTGGRVGGVRGRDGGTVGTGRTGAGGTVDSSGRTSGSVGGVRGVGVVARP